MKIRFACLVLAFGSLMSLLWSTARNLLMTNHVLLAVYSIIGAVLVCWLLLREEVGPYRGDQRAPKIVIMLRKFFITDKYVGRVCAVVFSTVAILLGLIGYMQVHGLS